MADYFYQPSRNIEKSLRRKITEILNAANYNNVSIVRSFREAADVKITRENQNAVIIVLCGTDSFNSSEIGSEIIERKIQLFIHICASSDGQRLDLKDIVMIGLKGGFDYYEYAIGGGDTEDAYFESGEVNDGQIIVDTISSVPINLDTDRSKLELADKYRQLITLMVHKTKLED